MSGRLRIALVGAGHMGQHHARAIAEREDAQLVAVCDVDPRAAAAVADRYRARTVASVRELVGKADAAVIATPTSAHREPVLTLIRGGVATLVEKPLAITAAEAGQIADAAERAGACVQVGHVLRFDPVSRALDNLPLKPTYIAVSWASPYTFRSTDIGVVMDLMIHGLDMVLAWVGEMPDRVDAAGGVVLGPNEDVADARLTFPSGCVATLSATRVSRSRQRLVRIFSEGAYVRLDYGARTVERIAPKPDVLKRIREGAATGGLDMESMVTVEKVPVEAEPDALRAQLASFLAAVRGQSAVAVPARQGAQVVEVAERIIQAIRSRRQGP